VSRICASRLPVSAFASLGVCALRPNVTHHHPPPILHTLPLPPPPPSPSISPPPSFLISLISLCVEIQSKQLSVAKGSCLSNTLGPSASLLISASALRKPFSPDPLVFVAVLEYCSGFLVGSSQDGSSNDRIILSSSSSSSPLPHCRIRISPSSSSLSPHHHHHNRHHHHHYHHHQHRQLAARHHGAIGPARQYERPDECCDGMLNRPLSLSLWSSFLFLIHNLIRYQDLLDMFDAPMEDSWTQLDGQKHDSKHAPQSYSSGNKVLTPSASLSSISSSSSSSSPSPAALHQTSGHPRITSQGATSSQSSSSITPRVSQTPADHGHRHNHKHQEKVCLTENILGDEHN